MAAEGGKDFFRVLVAVFLPPAGVFLQIGLGMHFWLNLLLTLLGWLPGQIHAVYVISTLDRNGREVPDGMATFVSLVIASLLPPVGVLMKKGFGMAFLVNCILCFFFWFPGILHALWVICNDD